MDLLLELLEDPAYRHVLLNHLPLTGLAFAWLVLAGATFEGRWRAMLFGLALVLVTSASALLVMQAGEDAYPFIYDRLDGVSRAWLDHHTFLADRWGWVLVGNAVATGLAIGGGFWRPAGRRALAILILCTTLIGLFTSAVLGEAGGKIRHPEFRLSDPPSHDTSGRRP